MILYHETARAIHLIGLYLVDIASVRILITDIGLGLKLI